MKTKKKARAPRKFQLAPADDLDFVRRSIDVNCLGFEIYQIQTNFNGVRDWAAANQLSFREIDKKMTALCIGNEAQLTSWAGRMNIVVENHAKIKRNLMVARKPSFSWPEVIRAMATLKAFEQGAKQTLETSGVRC